MAVGESFIGSIGGSYRNFIAYSLNIVRADIEIINKILKIRGGPINRLVRQQHNPPN